MTPRIKKTVLVTSLALALPVFVMAFAKLDPPDTVRTYFRAEQWLVEHWPVERQRWEIEKFAPSLCRIGILSPVRVEVEPGVSFLLDPRDLISVSILRGGAWQPEVWDSLAPALPEGGVLLDVGAHIGYFSIKGAVKVGKSGRVLSFEPNPETLKLLRANIAASHADNVTVEPIACTDKEQTLTLYAGPTNNTGMSSLASENVPLDGPARSYKVRGRPVDDVVRELNLTRVDAIKIDVEGAEVYVLQGALGTLKRFHPKLVIEVVREQLVNMHSTPEELVALIKSAGYTHSKPLSEAATDWEWTAQ